MRILVALNLMVSLLSKTSINLSARQILDSFDDPRALYVRWYRDGQSRVLTEALDALSDIIGADNDQEE